MAFKIASKFIRTPSFSDFVTMPKMPTVSDFIDPPKIDTSKAMNALNVPEKYQKIAKEGIDTKNLLKNTKKMKGEDLSSMVPNFEESVKNFDIQSYLKTVNVKDLIGSVDFSQMIKKPDLSSMLKPPEFHMPTVDDILKIPKVPNVDDFNPSDMNLDFNAEMPNMGDMDADMGELSKYVDNKELAKYTQADVDIPKIELDTSKFKKYFGL